MHFLLEYSLFLHDTILMLWYYSGVVNCIKSTGSQWEPRACPESDFTGKVNRRDKDFLDRTLVVTIASITSSTFLLKIIRWPTFL